MASLISVIIPVYNVEAYLRECLDSVIHQTYRHLEIILVDDGSTDTSGSICDEYAERDTRIRVIHKPNGGLSSARNAGMEVLTGEYVSFVDSDDWLELDTYEVCISEYEKNPQLDMLRFTFQYAVDKTSPPLPSSDYNPIQDRIYQGKEALECYVYGWEIYPGAVFQLYKVRDLSNFRFIEGIWAEDLCFMLEFLAHQPSYTVKTLAKRLYHYRVRSGSIMQDMSSKLVYDILSGMRLVLQRLRESNARHLPLATAFVLTRLMQLYKRNYGDSTQEFQAIESLNRECRKYPLKLEKRNIPLWIFRFSPWLYRQIVNWKRK